MAPTSAWEMLEMLPTGSLDLSLVIVEQAKHGAWQSARGAMFAPSLQVQGLSVSFHSPHRLSIDHGSQLRQQDWSNESCGAHLGALCGSWKCSVLLTHTPSPSSQYKSWILSWCRLTSSELRFQAQRKAVLLLLPGLYGDEESSLQNCRSETSTCAKFTLEK